MAQNGQWTEVALNTLRRASPRPPSSTGSHFDASKTSIGKRHAREDVRRGCVCDPQNLEI
jgi:hypothetical protein